MSTLTLIWFSAFALCALSIGSMLYLAAQRVIAARITAQLAKDRRAVEVALIGVMQGRVDVGLALADYRRRARLMAEALLDFMGVVRGGDRDLVVHALEAVGVGATLRRRLGHGSHSGRAAVIEALAVFPGPETEAALRAVAARDRRLRYSALESLAKIGADVPVAGLLEAVVAGELQPSGRVAEFLRERIVASPAEGREALESVRLTPALKVLLIDALGTSGDYGALPVLITHVGAREPLVRAAAVVALGRLQHPMAEPALRSAMADPDSEVRTAACAAAGAARFATLIEPLTERAGDEVWRVRFEATAALARLGPGGIERLRGLASIDAGPAARAAALTLAEQGIAA